MAVVLVVDDHPGMAGAVAAVVRGAGFDAAVAHSGPDALAFVRGRGADFVVLDVMMPGMSGVEVLRALRSGGEYGDPPPPVVMFSAGEFGREESMQLGAVGFVSKGETDNLLSLIERHLKPAAAGA